MSALKGIWQTGFLRLLYPTENVQYLNGNLILSYLVSVWQRFCVFLPRVCKFQMIKCFYFHLFVSVLVKQDRGMKVTYYQRQKLLGDDKFSSKFLTLHSPLNQMTLSTDQFGSPSCATKSLKSVVNQRLDGDDWRLG